MTMQILNESQPWGEWVPGIFKGFPLDDPSLSGRLSVVYEGYTQGFWGIDFSLSGWVVTHLPTGGRFLMSFKSLELAKAFAEALRPHFAEDGLSFYAAEVSKVCVEFDQASPGEAPHV